MPQSGVHIEGFDELLHDLTTIDKTLRKGFITDLDEIIEPVRVGAERLATNEIRNIGTKWHKMRSGVSRRFAVAYVAPVQRGLKTRGDDRRRRPRFADLLLDRAMEPALQENEVVVELGVEKMIDRVTRQQGF
jgi:hypothetical protein